MYHRVLNTKRLVLVTIDSFRSHISETNLYTQIIHQSSKIIETKNIKYKKYGIWMYTGKLKKRWDSNEITQRNKNIYFSTYDRCILYFISLWVFLNTNGMHIFSLMSSETMQTYRLNYNMHIRGGKYQETFETYNHILCGQSGFFIRIFSRLTQSFNLLHCFVLSIRTIDLHKKHKDNIFKIQDGNQS